MLEVNENVHEHPAGAAKPAPPGASAPRQSAAAFFDGWKVRLTGAWAVGAFAAGFLIFTVFYVKLAHSIDQRLAAGAFSGTLGIYTLPQTVAAGDTLTRDEVTARLRQSGYTATRGNPGGWYVAGAQTVEIFPGRDSRTGMPPAALEFDQGRLVRIVSLDSHSERPTFDLGPQLLTSISLNREKRQLVRFDEIPPVLVHAVISAEDQHFFHHAGFDFSRIVKAAYLDLRSGRKEQGASTLTMQLAREFWLDPDKSWRRKAQELLIAMHLENKLTKQQIFEDYANEVYLGRHGTYSISGFAEAAHAYFGKDLSQITTAEAALLAGLVQRPSYYNPARYPDRARERRNRVLTMMRRNGYLTAPQFEQALAAPVAVTREPSDSVGSQYFTDLMMDELQTRVDVREEHARFIQTTIDPALQQIAQDAVDAGMKTVDQQLHNRTHPIPAGEPQVALVALDPRTGEVRALVGGRNYRTSQFNHVLAMRQPGSAFKPFVYAAALDTPLHRATRVFTPASILNDVPTVFTFNHTSYQPNNFGHEFMGDVTLRTALALSLNVASVQLAQQVGYARVVALARRAGLNPGIQATPSMALGSYETTPMEIAGAYTIFANHGMCSAPTTIAIARAADGSVLYQHHPEPRPVLDPRVAYLMVSMMQDVLRSGTGASARAQGFTLPAAGKTGTTPRDGWFAGFTSELLCVVWVGFDDNRELNLEGARSALPVWTEFMKRASRLSAYRNAQPFQAPPGIVSVEICEDSGLRATDYCPDTRYEVFLNGTQPARECSLHGSNRISVGYSR